MYELRIKNMKKVFLMAMMALTLAGCGVKPAEEKKVYGRYVPERKDDFAWENEYAAWRVYGPALLAENPSNGIDLWLKNSPALAIDTMYARELKDGRPYHINYDGNLDCYKVGHMPGCGGLCVVCDSQLYIGGPYSKWEILEETSTKFQFRLEYDSLLVAGQIMQAEVTITAEAGTPLNRIDVKIMCPTKIRLPQLYAGGGIYLHEGEGELKICRGCGSVMYAENALSDKQAAQMNYEYNGSTDQGTCFIAVVTPGADMMEVMDNTAMSLKAYELGDTLTYYMAAGWSEWSNGETSFKNMHEWHDYTKDYIHSLNK